MSLHFAPLFVVITFIGAFNLLFVMDSLRIIVLSGQEIFLFLYYLSIGVLVFFSFHRLYLMVLYFLCKHKVPKPCGSFLVLPRVTIQLPIYNEGAVVERLLKHTACLRYPRELLDIQVLDDSNDGSQHLVAPLVSHYQLAGYDIQHLYRPHRNGFKGGALAAGWAQAKGEFLAVFDADFIPPPDFLEQTLEYFVDPRVGMVQTRWSYLNANDSLLTRAQAMLLDGHFIIEHTARHRSGCFFNFNGSAGLWRKAAVELAGGWQGDTLTEDLDLSFRAQLKGIHAVFLVQYPVLSELPTTLAGYKSQQHRWAKGGVQVLKKLIAPIMMSNLRWRVKAEACIQLAGNCCYPFVLLFGLLFVPRTLTPTTATFVDLPTLEQFVLFLATSSLLIFYTVAASQSGRLSYLQALLQVPLALVVGLGLSFSNTFAVLEGMLGIRSDFVRTPKKGREIVTSWRAWLVFGELVLLMYFTMRFVQMTINGFYQDALSVVLFICAFGYFFANGLQHLNQRVRARHIFPVLNSIPTQKMDSVEAADFLRS